MERGDFGRLAQLLNPPHYKPIGMVAANWSALELLVSSALWRLAKVDDDPGACLTSQIPNMARRLDAFAALVKLRGGSDGLIKKIQKFAERTHPLQEKRNRIVHDPWLLHGETAIPQRLEVSAKRALKFEYVPMPVAEIEKVIDAINDHIDAFDALMREVIAEVETSPETPP